MLKTRVGYCGGPTPSPTYGSVCANDGHTEALRVWFDPATVTYEQLLLIFFEEHDPTQRRGKAQYASMLFFHSPEQEATARRMVAALEAKHGVKVQTLLRPEMPWTDAEEHHQNFYGKSRSKRNFS